SAPFCEIDRPAAFRRSRRTGIARVDTRVTSIEEPGYSIHDSLELAEVHTGGRVLQMPATSLVAGISEGLPCRIELVEFEDHALNRRKISFALIRPDRVDRQSGLA